MSAALAGETLGLREMTATACRRRRSALLAFAAPVLLAIALLLVLPPKYRAQTDILVKTGREYLADNGADPGTNAPASSKQETINSEVALLTGRAVVAATIAEIGLTELYPSLAEPPWHGTAEDAAVYKFHKALRAEPIKLSNIITLSFDGASPDQARRVLDTLVRIAIARHAQVFASERSDGFARLVDGTRQEIERLEAERTRQRQRTGSYDVPAQRAASIARREAARAHLLALTDMREQLERRVAYLRAIAPTLPRMTQTTATDRDETGVHARQSLTDLRTAETALSLRYGDAYPDLQRVRAQIAMLGRTQPPAERTNVSAAPAPLFQQVQAELVMDQAQLAPMQAEEARYGALIQEVDGELSRLEQSDLELRLADARIATLTDELRTEQARLDQARAQEALDRERQVSLVQMEPSIVPDRAAKPNPALFLAGGLLLGLLGAGAVLIATVLTATTVATARGIEQLLGLPVLAALPAAGRRR